MARPLKRPNKMQISQNDQERSDLYKTATLMDIEPSVAARILIAHMATKLKSDPKKAISIREQHR